MAEKANGPLETFQPRPEEQGEVLLRASDLEAAELFELASQIKKLQPWRWMEETDLFGIEHPDTGELGFVSVMGSVGEYEAVALYLGAKGLYEFVALLENESNPALALSVPHVQVAFLDRRDLEKEDLSLIKQLGLKFKGRGAWPKFRSYRAGYLPWFITIQEARFLIHALSQVIQVAIKLCIGAQPFHPTGRVEEGGLPMRVARNDDSQLIWEDQVWRIAKPKPEPMRVSIDDPALESLQRIPRSKLELELDLMLVPALIGPRGQRPLAAYALMVADGESGFLFGCELLSAQDSYAAMYSRLPNVVIKLLWQAQVVPARVSVRSDKLRNVLKPLVQRLNVELELVTALPSIDEALQSMKRWMQEG